MNLIKRISIVMLASLMLVITPVSAENISATDAVNNLPVDTPLETKQPMSKRELAMKFIIAMLAVGASSVMIYVLLSVYNRFIYGTAKVPEKKSEDDEYKTPNNMKDALDIFYKKTKW